MISTTAAYALRAMIYLAEREGEGPVRVDDVATALDVPRNYLSKVMHALVKDGTLRSLRGPHGGFSLAVPAAAVTLYDIVRLFDEIEERRSCLLGCGECDEADPCAIHGLWSGVATDVAAFFRETALDEVVKDRTRVAMIVGQ